MLIVYACEQMPRVAQNYSITKLESCGLAINIARFCQLLKRVNFDTVIDHLALTHLVKSKSEVATYRIKRFSEVLSSCTFNIYYLKGKDTVLSDFLSRVEGDKSGPYEVIPVSFNSHSIFTGHYYTFSVYHQKCTE